ncbi:hypothetical protein Taro_029930 [Colocasia esculenta]|uniref:Uncharacterized protein n=1 Tax=Colocasia esculenta TaxID=4460 RepID=A0A843VWE6_COLES|nr:hypothetical protein [Colocasia esculenta]
MTGPLPSVDCRGDGTFVVYSLLGVRTLVQFADILINVGRLSLLTLLYFATQLPVWPRVALARPPGEMMGESSVETPCCCKCNNFFCSRALHSSNKSIGDFTVIIPSHWMLLNHIEAREAATWVSYHHGLQRPYCLTVYYGGRLYKAFWN